MEYYLEKILSRLLWLWETYGVSSTLYDAAGNVYAHCGGGVLFCRKVRGLCGESSLCGKEDGAARAAAFQRRGVHEYVCHAGLREVAVPLFCGGVYTGCIIMGKFVLEGDMGPSVKKFEEFLERSGGHADLMRDAFRVVPHLSDETYRAAVKELTEIAAAFSKKDRADGTLSALRDGSLQRAKELVLSGGRIKMEELRSEIGVSRAALRSLTLKHCGLSPSAFIAETNMLAAEDRLMNTEMSVFDIAAELGYSYRPFLRFFERHCGVTPSVFRISTYGEYRAARGRKDLPLGPF